MNISYYRFSLVIKILFSIAILYYPLTNYFYVITEPLNSDGSHGIGYDYRLIYHKFKLHLIAVVLFFLFFSKFLSKSGEKLSDVLRYYYFKDEFGFIGKEHLFLSYFLLFLSLVSIFNGGFIYQGVIFDGLFISVENYLVLIVSGVFYIICGFYYRRDGAGVNKVLLVLGVVFIILALYLKSNHMFIYGPFWGMDFRINFIHGFFWDLVFLFMFSLLLGRYICFDFLGVNLGRLRMDAVVRDNDGDVKFSLPFGSAIFLCYLAASLRLLFNGLWPLI